MGAEREFGGEGQRVAAAQQQKKVLDRPAPRELLARLRKVRVVDRSGERLERRFDEIPRPEARTLGGYDRLGRDREIADRWGGAALREPADSLFDGDRPGS